MRKGVLAAAGLALLAAVSWSAAPAQAMAISAPAALKGASDSISLAETVHCWGCGYLRRAALLRRPTTGRITAPTTDRIIGPTTPDMATGYPYYRPYRPYYRPYWGGGYGYGYGYYAPRPRFYFGPRVYWY